MPAKSNTPQDTYPRGIRQISARARLLGTFLAGIIKGTEQMFKFVCTFFLHSAILWNQRYLTQTVWEDREGSVHENEFFRFGEFAYAS